MRLTRWINGLCFFATAVPLSLYLSSLDRYPPVFNEKLAYYLDQADAIDTLFIGSSYMYFGLDPKSADLAMHAEGIPSRSFNMSYGGAKGHEIDEMLRIAIRKGRGHALRQVVVDIRPFSPIHHDLFEGTENEAWWRSPYQARSAIRSAFRAKIPPREKMSLALRNIRLLFRNYVPLGAWKKYQDRKENAVRNRMIRGFFHREGGFQPLKTEPGSNPLEEMFIPVGLGMLKFRDRTLKDPEKLREATESLATHAYDTTSLDHVNVEAWKAQADFARRHGIRLVHVLMPTVDNPLTLEANTLARDGVFPHYLNFNDPNRFPELFEMDARFERWHLNEQGAQKFSALLGKALAELGRPTEPASTDEKS